ncbi:MAG TPA: DUF5666 domain-containing protein [Solirubrobacteraceae bacterium]|jgi:hypothetical protein
MDAVTYDRHEPDWDRYADEAPDEDRMPGRPRRQYFNRWSAALVALITCAIGFYAGVRVEKGQVSSSSSAVSSAAAGFAARARALAGGTTAAGPGAGASEGAARTGASGAGASGAGASGAGASAAGAFGGRGGSGASFGTVSSVKGGSIYVTTPSGNTVKVKLSSSTKISKNLSVGRKSIRPGDTVVIQGLTSSSGNLVAAAVSDSGAAGSGRGGGSGSASGGGSGSNSAIGSLFSSGGGG